MTFCPACGNPVSDTSARFCMKCGKELPAAGAPPAPVAPPTPTQVSPAPVAPPPPPPPTYAAPTATFPGAGPAGYPPPPAPVAPSPAAQFIRRVFTGRWDAALVTALVPALVLLVAAGALGAWSQHALKGPLSWMLRSRIALAAGMQGLGGHLSAKAPNSDCSEGDSGYGDSGDSGSDYGDSGSDYGDSGSDFGDSGSDFGDSGGSGDYSGIGSQCANTGGGVSILLLAFTLLWLLALVLALRSMRRRQTGAEAAVRVALLSGIAAMVLAFVAEPKIQGVRIHTAPFLVLLWTFLFTLVTALVVLHGPALTARLGAAYRVAGAAFLGLLVTVLFAGLVVFLIAVGYQDNVTGNGLVAFGVLAPNLGVSGLALGFGAPLQITYSSGSDYGSGGRSMTTDFGLSKLNDYWGGAATPLAVLAAALCALAVGFIAVRRTRNPVEQFAVAGAFTAMFTVLVSIADFATGRLDVSTSGYVTTGGGEHIGSSVTKSLLFALLWSAGGVLAASFLRRVFGPPLPPAVAYGTPGGPYGLSPQAHNTGRIVNPYVPQQPGPQAYPYQQPPGQQQPPQPQTGPPVPPPTQEVHDLGVVQPDRLSKPDNPPEGGGRHQ